MALVQEFKEFAIKGNVVDLAVGFIVGGAFGKIVTSLVNDVVLPPIGLVLGGTDFTDLLIPLDGGSYDSLDAAREAGAPVIAYGSFLQTTIDFLIVAFVIFVAIRAMNRLRREQEQAPPEEKPVDPPEDIKLLQEIRDALQTKG